MPWCTTRGRIAALLCCIAVSAFPACSALDLDGPCSTNLGGSEPSHARSTHYHEDHAAGLAQDDADGGGDNGDVNATESVKVTYSTSADTALSADQLCYMSWAGFIVGLCALVCGINCCHSLQIGPFSDDAGVQRAVIDSIIESEENPTASATFEKEG